MALTIGIDHADLQGMESARERIVSSATRACHSSLSPSRRLGPPYPPTHLEPDVEREPVRDLSYLTPRRRPLDPVERNARRLDPHCRNTRTQAGISLAPGGCPLKEKGLTEEACDDSYDENDGDDDCAAADSSAASPPPTFEHRTPVLITTPHPQPFLFGNLPLCSHLNIHHTYQLTTLSVAQSPLLDPLDVPAGPLPPPRSLPSQSPNPTNLRRNTAPRHHPRRPPIIILIIILDPLPRPRRVSVPPPQPRLVQAGIVGRAKVLGRALAVARPGWAAVRPSRLERVVVVEVGGVVGRVGLAHWESRGWGGCGCDWVVVGYSELAWGLAGGRARLGRCRGRAG